MAPLSTPRGKILIVDDDPDVLRALTFMAETRGWEVHRCATAKEALAGAEDGFACLIIDQNLPDVQGIELLSALRDRGVRTPAVLVTTAPPAPLRRRAAAAGAPIVEKPLLDEALFDQIEELIRPA